MAFGRARRAVAALAVVLAGAPAFALSLAPAATATAAEPSWHEGVCSGSEGVTVVVDFGSLGRGSHTRCALEPVGSGFDALTRAGFTFNQSMKFPGLLCRIDGLPDAEHEACVNAPAPDYYWAYWTATGPGAPWVYSDLGAGSRQPPPGSVDGWAFSDGCTRRPGAPTACAGGSTTTTTPTSSPSTPTTAPGGGSPGTTPDGGPDAGVTTSTSTAGRADRTTTTGSDGQPTNSAVTAPTAGDEEAAGEVQIRSDRPGRGDEESAGSPVGVIAAALAVISVGTVALVRRRRQEPE